MRWRGPKIKPSLSSLSTNNSHAYLFIIWSTPFKTEIIKCDTIFLFFCIVFAILQNLSPPPVSPFYHSIQLYIETISDSLPCLWKSFQSWISITLNSPQCFSPCLRVYGAVRVGFCPVIIKTKGKSRSVNQFLLPKGLLPVYMLLCEQRLDILPLWVRTQNSWHTKLLNLLVCPFL